MLIDSAELQMRAAASLGPLFYCPLWGMRKCAREEEYSLQWNAAWCLMLAAYLVKLCLINCLDLKWQEGKLQCGTWSWKVCSCKCEQWITVSLCILLPCYPKWAVCEAHVKMALFWFQQSMFLSPKSSSEQSTVRSLSFGLQHGTQCFRAVMISGGST